MFIFRLMLCIWCPFIVAFCIYFLYFRFVKHIKFKKSAFPKNKKSKEDSLFYRLFIAFPRQYALDFIRRNPDEFPFSERGLYIIEGEQGAGKTTTMTYLLNKLQKQYPALKVYSNYHYAAENEPFYDWRKQFEYEVGETGGVYAIDEIHIWLCSSLQSKDFPPELLTQICQNRKNHRAIYGTVQVFGRCPKPIREQCKLLFSPYTIAGCLTFVIVRKPIVDENGKVLSYKFRRLFFFVQTDELRSLFDTYDIIKKMEVVKDNALQTVINVNNTIVEKSKSKVNVKRK